MKSINFIRNEKDSIQSRSLAHSASMKMISLEHTSIHLKTEISQMSISTSQLQHQYRQYQWRIKTQFPIVKIIRYTTMASYNDHSILEIQHENFPLRLMHLKDLPLFKILYLLKQSLIGFERLYNKVGAFKITPNMIAINQKYKCKVWLNQSFASNTFEVSFGGQREFLRSICTLLQVRGNKQKNTLLFFNDLRNFTSFCQILSYIENYARQNKITISTQCKPNPSEKVIIQEQVSTSKFDPTLTMGRAPKFINNLRSSLSNKMDSNFTDMFKRYNTVSEMQACIQQKKIQMKASGDTAADNNTQSFQNIDQQLVNSTVFQQTQKKTETKSFLPITNKNNKLHFGRSLSGENYQIQCFTPSYQRMCWGEQNHHFGSPINDVAFLGSQEEEQNEVSHSTINNLFTKNHWEQTLNGLFENQQSLKASFHHGKQIKKTQLTSKTLKLLDSIGKTVFQSNIQNE